MNNQENFPSPYSEFYPQWALINSITQGQNTVVGFTAPHTFTVGEIVSFRVSKPYGMTELNNQDGLVIAITTTTITVPIDSTNYTPFSSPLTMVAKPAMAVPSASGVIPDSRPSMTNLLDSFDNIPKS